MRRLGKYSLNDWESEYFSYCYKNGETYYLDNPGGFTFLMGTSEYNVVEYGFHSFRYKNEARDICEGYEFEEKEYEVVECEIPKGCRYCLGRDCCGFDTFVSDVIKIKGIIENFKNYLKEE
ncbi:MAG: hypothetical protein J6X18_07360 [Bacteroidales bacterium]|nr:hypothetical protein [Bacteroidales bacterium]